MRTRQANQSPLWGPESRLSGDKNWPVVLSTSVPVSAKNSSAPTGLPHSFTRPRQGRVSCGPGTRGSVQAQSRPCSLPSLLFPQEQVLSPPTRLTPHSASKAVQVCLALTEGLDGDLSLSLPRPEVQALFPAPSPVLWALLGGLCPGLC